MRFTADTRGSGLKSKISPLTYMKGSTYVRTYSARTIFSEPKFRGCIVYQIFLPMVLRCARFVSKSSAIKTKSATIALFSSPPFLLHSLSFSPLLFPRYYDFEASWA